MVSKKQGMEQPQPLIIIHQRVSSLGFRTGDYGYFRWSGFTAPCSLRAWLSYRFGTAETRHLLIDEAAAARRGDNGDA